MNSVKISSGGSEDKVQIEQQVAELVGADDHWVTTLGDLLEMIESAQYVHPALSQALQALRPSQVEMAFDVTAAGFAEALDVYPVVIISWVHY